MKNLFTLTITVLLLITGCQKETNRGSIIMINETTIQDVINQLSAKYPAIEKGYIEKGIKQVAMFWRSEDGTIEDFKNFCLDNYIADENTLRSTFERLQKNLELINGYMIELSRDLSIPLHLDTGPLLPIDYLFGEFSPAVHLQDDFFKTKIAFIVLLNFPVTTLEERLANGKEWTREQWAKVRLAQGFARRVPAEANQKVTEAYNRAENYISSYNIYMHNVLDENGNRLFPEGKILLSHWNLRDELKAQYANPDGLPRQELIQTVMEKIIKQEIPKSVINNPDLIWSPSKNQVTKANEEKTDIKVDNTPEPNTRYEMWMNIYKAQLEIDKYYPHLPTLMDRKFKEEREIPEEQFENLLKSILTSNEVKEIGKLIEKRLGRKLKPFDIWYNGFKVSGKFAEEELDKIVQKKYPNIEAFKNDLPNILKKLGFSEEMSKFLASKIEVDPARGSGHAMAAGRLVDNAHLRTRVPKGGMNYKGYNIAMHELGHNVEQVLSFNKIDYTLLRGVPNTAFTEGFAFVFQSRDLEVLGIKEKDENKEYLDALNSLWQTYEIAGVALVDMYAWHWLYKNPNATPQQFKEAVISIAKDVWNQYYAPIFEEKDVILLAIYSHMINSGLYTPDYPLGHIIAFQIEQYLKDKNLGKEMERMCKLGAITPDLWMQLAVGEPISTTPMLSAANKALQVIK
ncbi:MAG: hypothetical protein IGBAC_1587 [Ignavibacteriae bacterium]|nr:MAG: hypothetical protein IGBAC_1587 [Ignavibacteriota bacterium]